MKKLLFIYFFCVSVLAFAQTDTTSNWKKTFETGLNVNQASFSENWKGGGTNSIALGTFINTKCNYETKFLSFVNTLELQYGFQKNKDQASRKTADKIFFDSKLGYKISPKWNLFASINFLSQFDDGFSYTKDANGAEVSTLISRFMSPGYLTSSIGIEYTPVNYFWMRFGTGTWRQTFVTDRQIYLTVPKNYGVSIGKTVLNDVAFQFIASFDKDIASNINLKIRYNGLADYQNIQAVTSRLDLVCTAKITKFINVNFSATALYDQNMDYEIQYTQTFALGIMYSISK